MNRLAAGFSMVLVVMILLMLGVVMMTALNHQLSAQLRINRDEHVFIKSQNQAISSLNWGLQQSWPEPDENWYCQQQQHQVIRACIKQVAGSALILVKNSSDELPMLTFYSLALGEKVTNDDSVSHYIRLIRQPSGWLDFCPIGDNQC